MTQRLQSSAGATAVEYAIMAALIGAVIVLVVVVLGQQTTQAFCTASDSMEAGGISATGTVSSSC